MTALGIEFAMNNFPSKPHYVQFYPTLQCNLSCSFCFNRGIGTVKDISITDCAKVVGCVSDIGVKKIDILGGEPTLHSDFLEIVNLIRKVNLKTTISSNGCNVHLLKRLSQTYKRDQVRIGVSLNSNSVSGRLHEYITEQKPFLKSVCSKEVSVAENGGHYLSLPSLRYYLIYMDAVCRDDLEMSLPFWEFLKRLDGLKSIHKNMEGVFCSGFLPDNEYPVLQYVRCPAGTTKLSIMPDGSVYPCYLFARYDNFRLGNILNDDFSRIWRSPILDFFRTFEQNPCPNKDCELFHHCHGGCPAVSLLILGDMNAADPRCVNPPPIERGQ
jgi:radical SAM protein with 4Fe4S-binding SPASM domain